ncbi:LysM domain-containing protein [Microbacterium panaciterrae]|uniref:LysM domain-containing protein n=1 Tax=Microbacterium panaciterrae TaxID=985759 RepID=A0ABP8P3A3_9MICO
MGKLTHSPALLATAFAGLAFLAGCTADEPAVHHVTSNSHTPAHTDDGKAATTSVTVATGTLASPDQATSGTVKIEETDGRFSITVSDFVSSHPGQVSILLNEPETSVCEQAAYAWNAGETAPESVLTALLPSTSPGWTNPSNFVALTIAQTDPASSEGCDLKGIASAPLKWTLTDPRPSLRPIDSGSEPGAEGTVTSAGGIPTSYLVAADDTYRDIAKRLGISVDDLEYLNPDRAQGDYTHPTVNLGTTLNLDPARR